MMDRPEPLNERNFTVYKTLQNIKPVSLVLIFYASCFFAGCGEPILPRMQTGQVAPNSVEFFEGDFEALSRGNAIYLGSCANFCHEYSLPEGHRLNLFDCSWIYSDSNEDIASVIVKGVKGTRMPGFGDNFPEAQDLKKVVAYLRSSRRSCELIL